MKFYNESWERPEGVIINKLCNCGCGKKIIYSFNRMARGQEPPDYIWGHGNCVNGHPKTEFQPGHIPWDKGIHRPKETRKKISEAREGRNLPGMFQKGHKRTKGKNHPMYGKHHSEKTNKKISESQIKRYKKIDKRN